MESRFGMTPNPSRGHDISCPYFSGIARFLEVRAAGLFESVGELEHAGFAEDWAEDLKANGEIFLRRFATGHGNAGHTRQRAGDGVDVGEIHLERVIGFFAEFEGRDGRSRR